MIQPSKEDGTRGAIVLEVWKSLESFLRTMFALFAERPSPDHTLWQRHSVSVHSVVWVPAVHASMWNASWFARMLSGRTISAVLRNGLSAFWLRLSSTGPACVCCSCSVGSVPFAVHLWSGMEPVRVVEEKHPGSRTLESDSNLSFTSAQLSISHDIYVYGTSCAASQRALVRISCLAPCRKRRSLVIFSLCRAQPCRVDRNACTHPLVFCSTMLPTVILRLVS